MYIFKILKYILHITVYICVLHITIYTVCTLYAHLLVSVHTPHSHLEAGRPSGVSSSIALYHFYLCFNCFLFIWLLVLFYFLFKIESHYEPWLAWNSLYRPVSVARLKACATKPISLPSKKKVYVWARARDHAYDMHRMPISTRVEGSVTGRLCGYSSPSASLRVLEIVL